MGARAADYKSTPYDYFADMCALYKVYDGPSVRLRRAVQRYSTVLGYAVTNRSVPGPIRTLHVTAADESDNYPSGLTNHSVTVGAGGAAVDAACDAPVQPALSLSPRPRPGTMCANAFAHLHLCSIRGQLNIAGLQVVAADSIYGAMHGMENFCQVRP